METQKWNVSEGFLFYIFFRMNHSSLFKNAAQTFQKFLRILSFVFLPF